MSIFQLPQTIKRGSIYGSSQNFRELAPVSLLLVMSDWILPFLVIIMGQYILEKSTMHQCELHISLPKAKVCTERDEEVFWIWIKKHQFVALYC